MEGKFSNENPSHVTIQADATTKCWGAYYKVVSTGRKWSKEKHFRINVLESLALKSAVLTFTKNLSHLTIHVQVDKVGLAYLLKMGGTRSPQLLKSKSIWNYLLSRQITITAEQANSPGMQQTIPIGNFIRKFI